MASVKNNIVMTGLSGGLAKQLVVKQYSYGTVVTSYPDMSKVVPSKKQKEKRSTFKEAVAYAKSVMADPEKKKAYTAILSPGKSVYHAAIKDFLENN